MPPKAKAAASHRRPTPGSGEGSVSRNGRVPNVEIGGPPKRSKSAPTHLHPVSSAGTHVNNLRALRRTSTPETDASSSEGSLGSEPGSARQQSQKPSAHQRVYSTWNKLQMGDQSNFLHQHARSIEGVLSPKTNRPKNTGPWEMQELDGIQVEDSYVGPRLMWPFGWPEIMELLQFYRKDIGAVLHRRYAIQILLLAKELLLKRVTSALVEFEVQPGQTLTICGDTHGQLPDVLWIFHLHGYPSEKNIYLFNGDIADRGENAVQIFLILFAMMLVLPGSIMINRGNHEDQEMNELPLFAGGGFAKEVRRKYGGRTFSLFQELFNCLPLAMVVNRELLIIHGGLPRHIGVRLEHIRNIDYHIQPPVPDSYQHSIFFDLLWSDPKVSEGVGPSRRGPFCITFGPDITNKFLDDNCLAVCVRSHEVPTTMRGFEVKHDNRMVTVFSASNYCGSTGNFGAVLKVKLKSDASTSPRNAAPDILPATLRISTPEEVRTPTSMGRGRGQSPRAKSPAGRGTAHHLPPLTATARIGPMRPLGLGGLNMSPIANQQLALPKLQMLYCTAHEHWAPSLSELPNETSPSNVETAEQQRLAAERAAISTPRGHQKMKAEILDKIRLRILEKRQELMWHYLHLDKKESARVTLQQWQEGLEAVLHLDIPWMEYQADLVVVDQKNCVDYRRFLHRFRIGVSPSQGHWPALRQSQLYNALMEADLTVDEAVHLFSGDPVEATVSALLKRSGKVGDGITWDEVKDVIEMVKAMGSDLKVQLQADELLALFVVMFDTAINDAEPSQGSSSSGGPHDLATSDDKEDPAHGLQALPFPSDFLKTFQSSGRACVQLFREFDQSKTGYLQYLDFVQGMQKLWSQSQPLNSKLEGCQSRAELMELAACLDTGQKGHITVLQFCRAFYAKDSAIAADTIMQQLYTILYENVVTLRRACRFYDDDEDGMVSVQEFKEALLALNTLLYQRGNHLSPLHIAIIAVHGCRSDGGSVKYAEFFDSFAVVDAEVSPTQAHQRSLSLSSSQLVRHTSM